MIHRFSYIPCVTESHRHHKSRESGESSPQSKKVRKKAEGPHGEASEYLSEERFLTILECGDDSPLFLFPLRDREPPTPQVEGKR
jgi:hypothetical protein